jgi:hypothetical protein
MKLIRIAVVFALSLLGGIVQAAVQTVLPPGASWQYTFDAPGSGWQIGADAGVAWRTGNSPFSNCGPVGGIDCVADGWTDLFNANTRWPADDSGAIDDDLWVRTQIDLSGSDMGTLQVQWALGVDNGYTLYINGVPVSQDNAEGFTDRWEYTGTVPAALVSPSTNWIAVALEDHGGLTAFDMTVTVGTDGRPAPIPEPQTYALMLAGLAILGTLVRRKHTVGAGAQRAFLGDAASPPRSATPRSQAAE